MNLSDKSVCVIDGGGFPFIAERLARDFGKCHYWTPAVPPEFPKSYSQLIGEGMDHVERLADDDVFELIADKECDLYVFCDVNNPGLQRLCRSLGLRTWGLGDVEYIETDRWALGDVLTKHNLARTGRQLVSGLEELEQVLNRRKECYVKVNRWRGDMETTKWDDPFLLKPWLQNLRNNLGIAGHKLEFVVEEPVEGVEIGFDGWVVDGKYPAPCLAGYEVKDAGYIGRVYDKLPAPLQEINDQLAPFFARSRGFYANEIRVAKDGNYLIDPTCRAPSPPSQLWCELFENFSEIVYAGAGGELITPKPKAKYGTVGIIKSDADDPALEVPIEFPKEYARFVKFRDCYYRQGKVHILPQTLPVPEIGAVVGIGDDPEDAIAMATEIGKSVKGYGVKVCTAAFEDAKDVIEKGHHAGIDF